VVNHERFNQQNFLVTFACSLCLVKFCVMCVMCKFFCFLLPALVNKDEYNRSNTEFTVSNVSSASASVGRSGKCPNGIRREKHSRNSE